MTLSRRSLSQVGLSSVLLVLTYGTFGWLVAAHRLLWAEEIVAWLDNWGIQIALDLVQRVILIASGMGVLALVFLFSIPMRVMQIFFGAWLQENISAVVSVLIWACVAVVICTQLIVCTRLAVLGTATLLARLDFQAWGLGNWPIFCLLTVMGVSSFLLGFTLVPETWFLEGLPGIG